MIGGNGSYVESDGKVIFHKMIGEKEARQIVDYLHSENLEFYLESNSGLFASEKFESEAVSAIQKYSKRKGKENSESLTVRQAFPDMIFGGELYRNDLNKVSYLLRTFSDFTKCQESFPSLQHGTWGGKGEEALFGDISLKGISKKNAIQTLLLHLEIQKLTFQCLSFAMLELQWETAAKKLKLWQIT